MMELCIGLFSLIMMMFIGVLVGLCVLGVWAIKTGFWKVFVERVILNKFGYKFKTDLNFRKRA